ncbi:two-component sensor histidine kinase [Rhodococcus sp. 06-462-5]|nr:two-component sensor histidine kinase [Rhodococcus sp. 06-462-5]OZE65480.1 two-component sensor histidine kinase [Rhodococcus sp. 02-925g]
MAAATTLGATLVVAALSVVTSVAISRNNVNQLDERLTTASQVLVPTSTTLEAFLDQLSGAFAVTIRSGDIVVASTPTRLPALDTGSQTVDVDGQRFRVYTAVSTAVSSISISIGVPAIEAQQVTDEQQKQVLMLGLAAIAVSTGLGWLFGGRAVRPLVTLTRQVSAQPPTAPETRTGVTEADALAVAIGGMLTRLNEAQDRTNAALDTARDFAAVSAHELRTPLTAMRTDIEVLRTLDLEPTQQQEILGDLERTQGRVETTLTALERLASGELSSEGDRVETDIIDICDVAAQDAQRLHPGLDIRVEYAADSEITMRALPTGLRLAVDNVIGNAVRHGDATSIVITAEREGTTVRVLVDDNGSGVPLDERETVFGRFERGTRAAKGGSGLGLALVAQQAQLHGGRAWFTDSPLGGARLVLELQDS